MSDELTKLKNSRGGYRAAITRRYNEINSLLTSPENFNQVFKLHNSLADAWDKYTDAHRLVINYITDKAPDKLREEEKHYEDVHEEMVAFDRKITDWKEEAQQMLSDNIKTKDSASQAASSVTSSIALKRMEEEAAKKVAAIRLQTLEKERKIEDEKRALRLKLEEDQYRLEQEAKILKAKAELEECQAREQVYNASVVSRKSRSRITTPVYQPHQQPAATAATDWSNHFLQSASASIFLPKQEVPTFSGDPLEYWMFMNSFKTLIEDRVLSPSQRLHYLIQYTTGDVKELVRSCVALEPSAGYEQALSLLKSRYGQEYRIATAYIDRLTKGPQLKSDDTASLQKLSVLLASCSNILGNIGCLRKIENPDAYRAIIARLPYDLRKRWRTKADNISEDQCREIEFKDIVKFVEREARTASHPIFGDIKGATNNDQPNKRPKDTKPKKTLATVVAPQAVTKGQSATPTQSERSSTTSSGNSSYVRERKCPLCAGPHGLYECTEFKQQDVESRAAHVKRLGLCFNCFIPRHMSRDCRKNYRCSICSKKHSTLLHREEQPEPEPKDVNEKKVGATLSASSSVSECIGLPIVPVDVKTSHGGTVRTNAFLDTGSNMTFITAELVDKLSLQGRKSSILLSTLEKSKTHIEGTVYDLELQDDEGNVSLHSVMQRPSLPITTADIPTQSDINRWYHLHGIEANSCREPVGLLIGNDNVDIIQPLELRQAAKNGPYAVRTRYGWTINGPLGRYESAFNKTANAIKADSINLSEQFKAFCDHEFNESLSDPSTNLSMNDKKALKMMDSSTVHKEGHYTLDLPVKTEDLKLPDNKPMAERRLMLLKKRLLKEETIKTMYNEFMETLFKKGFAEILSDEEAQATPKGRTWYLPHHAVVNPNKPGKVRVVFDCSAKYSGVCLNDVLWQGPDLNNTLIGVLLRFRQYPIAITSDVEAMFYQVFVSEPQRDLLRFLWWKDGVMDQEPIVCRMRVHIFGATSSPSCCTYALQRTAQDHKADIDEITFTTVMKNFYMDDCLVSTPDIPTAIRLHQQLTSTLAEGGFHLTKWTSNSPEVLSSIPEEERAAGVKTLDMSKLQAPTERALGVRWDINHDEFTFSHIGQVIKDKPPTRRGILSQMSSIFDPLGFVCPVTLHVKQLLQELCRLQTGWDEPVPSLHLEAWNDWVTSLPDLADFHVPRCLLLDPQEVRAAQIHHFCDASERGYGSVSYLRTETRPGDVTVNFLIAKSRVTPLKKITIPRLELSAATLAVKIDKMLKSELQVPILEAQSVFWTDSTAVLKYINNDNTRFHTFVANRLALIQDGTTRESWRYVPSSQNPADDASRGLTPSVLIEQDRWLHGPPFLKEAPSHWPQVNQVYEPISPEDPEVKTLATVKTEISTDPIETLLHRFSSWFELRKTVAWLLRIKKFMYERAINKKAVDVRSPLTSQDMEQAELEVVKLVQRTHYQDEISTLSMAAKKNELPRLKKSSSLYKLNPVLDGDVLRIQGRTAFSPIDRKQYVLPSHHHVTNLVIQYYHLVCGHSGRQHVLSQLHEKYWVIHGNAAVRRVLGQCMNCRKLQGPPGEQKMAALPDVRLQVNKPPFSSTGIDYFGPLSVRRGRAQVKRYALLFTCLTTRAVHIEMAYSLDTDAFLNALNRFMTRRGKPAVIVSDNGGSFVKGEKLIREGTEALNQAVIHDHLLSKGIDWRFNPPLGSHHGGIWERCIRTARKILSSLMKQQTLDDDGLQTLLCEVESVMNSRPITSVSNDPRDLEALTPNHLLLFKAGDAKMPLDVFHKTDLYNRHWRQVQYLSDVFWRRWVKEYLPLLKETQKWNVPKKNFAVNNLVLLMDTSLPRNLWSLGRIVKVFPGRDGLVRRVEVRTKHGLYERPIDKLIMLDN